MEGMNKAKTAAETIRKTIAALRKSAAELSAAGRQNEAEALHVALDGLQKSLKRIRVDEDGKVQSVH